nr:ATP-binding domain-containing protein [Herbaspirillum sp. ASV7]
MNIRFFSGGAGCGKTHQIMEAIAEHVQKKPLQDGQKVLALTFMHGSRRRLHDRLGQVKEVRPRFECMVIDSLAWRVVSRWQELLKTKGRELPAEGNFESVCESAAILLNEPVVGQWLAATYPVFILDEAQDLNRVRLEIVIALAAHMDVIAAADEFQCLNPELRGNNAFTWLAAHSEMVTLTEPKRTNVAELLDAAHAIRAGNAPVSGRLFQVAATAQPALAGTFVSNQYGWYGARRQTAILTTGMGNFTERVTRWVGAEVTKRGNGPYSFTWELSESKAIATYMDGLRLPEHASAPDIYGLVQAMNEDRATRDVQGWLDMQRRTQGRIEFSRDEIVQVIERSFRNRKNGISPVGRQSLQAMTIQGAKNREFNNVVVLWPAATVGDDEQLRRLLYNAVTRAKERCLVLVQAQGALGRPPFA